MSDKYKDKEKGEVDPELANGPIESRSCQDILCCLLFIASIVAMVAIFITGVSQGKPKRLAAPYDPDGYGCGIDSNRANYPYIYFPTPVTGIISKTVCLKNCPQNQSSTLDCVVNSVVTDCSKGFITWDQFKALSTEEAKKQAFVIYPTKQFVGRICVPSTEILKSFNLNKVLNFDYVEKWVNDIKDCWSIILASFFIALVVSFIYVLLMRYCSGVFVWLIVLLYFVLMIVLGYLCFKKAKDQEENKSENATVSSDTLKYTAIVIWAIAGVSLLCILCCFSRIRLAIAIIKTAAVFIKDVKSVLSVPFIIGFILLVFWTIWIVGLIYLYSTGEIKKSNKGPFAQVIWEDKTRYMIIYWIFGGLWKNAFILAISQFVIASSASIWYFTKHSGVHRPVSRSFYRVFRYHLGSLAFGSLILAIVQFVRLVLQYIKKKMDAAGKSNKCMEFLFCCLQCCLDCFERFIKFMNKNVYIQIALQGKNFCTSMRKAFKIILCNPARFSIVGLLGSIFILIGKVFIMVVTALIGYIIITNADHYNKNIYSPWAPTLIIAIIGYSLGVIFMNVVGMAIDAILQCFIVDEELNKSNGRDPQYTPETLRDFMNEVDKKHSN